MGGQGSVCVVLRFKSPSEGRPIGCDLFVGDAGWELGLKLSVGQEVAMGLWDGSYQWGSGVACRAVMWQLLSPQGRAGAGGE